MMPSPESLSIIINRAFEYRGDITIDKLDGETIVGYLFNRLEADSQSYVEVMETDSGKTLRLPYAQIGNIRLTGRDTSASKRRDPQDSH